eukprot:scaffold5310_cov378-Prasinococcus_capsulatus_cf.AAC.14
MGITALAKDGDASCQDLAQHTCEFMAESLARDDQGWVTAVIASSMPAPSPPRPLRVPPRYLRRRGGLQVLSSSSGNARRAQSLRGHPLVAAAASGCCGRPRRP